MNDQPIGVEVGDKIQGGTEHHQRWTFLVQIGVQSATSFLSDAKTDYAGVSYPHVDWQCVGTVIDQNWIITTAACCGYNKGSDFILSATGLSRTSGSDPF